MLHNDRLAITVGLLLLPACGGDGTGPSGNDRCAQFPIAQDSRSWTLNDLGTPAPMTYSQALGVAGAYIAGKGDFPGVGGRGFRWSPGGGAPIRLDPGPGDDYALAYFVNHQGVAVGESINLTIPQVTGGVLWRGTSTPEIPPAPGITPHGINDAGIVVDASRFPGNASFHASLWQPGQPIRDLGALDPATSESEAFGINNAGTVVGLSSTMPNVQEAFIWTEQGGMRSIGRAGTGASSTWPRAINDCGIIVGSAMFPGQGWRAWRWKEGSGFTLLPLPPGATSSFAVGVDSLGVAFGNVEFQTPAGVRSHPYAWPGQGFITLPDQGYVLSIRGADRCGHVAAEGARDPPGAMAPILLFTAPC